MGNVEPMGKVKTERVQSTWAEEISPLEDHKVCTACIST